MDQEKIKEAFTKVYHNKSWGEKTSDSGPGSTMEQTAVIRPALVDLIRTYKIKKMIDAPCGDLNWIIEVIENVRGEIDSYTGIDIVKDLIQRNTEEYGNEKVHFLNLNLIEDTIPRADLILTRDCFIHLSFANIFGILKNYKKSGSTYVLISTYTNTDRVNVDVNVFFINGRALNMQQFPFSFPEPVLLINEKCTEGNGASADKSLALWKLDQIPFSRIAFNLKYLSVKKLAGRIMNRIKKTFN